MREYRLNSPVTLNVAADAGMMLIVRLTTAGVVTRAGLTIDAMDNLKIATEEACNCLINQTNPPRRIALEYSCADGELHISLCALESECPQGAVDEVEMDVVRCILESLADGVDLTCATAGSTVSGCARRWPEGGVLYENSI